MLEAIEELEQIMEKLRDPKHGCPWDLEQSFDSIIPHTIEETYEVVDAIYKKDWVNLQEELGDLLFQIIFYSQLAKEQQFFTFDDVVKSVNEKLIRRHPHVFSDLSFSTPEELAANWEQQKKREKEKQNKPIDQSILSTIPTSLPALSKAYKLQKACAKVGFDWGELPPIIDKIQEEIDEVLEETKREPIDKALLELEVGDLLFTVVNLSRQLQVNPESALSKANIKFINRFQGVEELVRRNQRNLIDCSLAELDMYWSQVKMQEKSKK
ncbi:nucleoside triphosphate pyrophosphohydrolase [Vibrio sp.]|nr:nucleoside triphosphate pyrophosphohydrolase [Vibrio sp.]